MGRGGNPSGRAQEGGTVCAEVGARLGWGCLDAILGQRRRAARGEGWGRRRLLANGETGQQQHTGGDGLRRRAPLTQPGVAQQRACGERERREREDKPQRIARGATG